MAQWDRVFIAEKPSLAEGIALAVGEITGATPTKGGGYWTVGRDAVIPLFGHMLGQADPNAYGEKWAHWDLASLPIIIPHGEQWLVTVAEDKAEQIERVRTLVSNARTIVGAGDAGREGQNIVDEILVLFGIDPFAANVKRLWVSSMTRKDLVAGVNGLLPNASKRNLSDAALCRQRADWQFGMTFTRGYTVLARQSGADNLISVGRVQTPTLALIVQRDLEIERFRPVDHYLPAVSFRHVNGTFTAAWVIPEDIAGVDSEGRLTDRKVAEGIAAKVAGKHGKLTGYTTTPKSKPCPAPFSLSALQAAASAKLGLTADETLMAAQNLYEARLTTYPRTDCQQLPLSLKPEVPGILRALAGMDELGDAPRQSDPKRQSACWKQEITSDHHGIVPTAEFSAAKLAQRSEAERQVFKLIACVFLCQFFPDYQYLSVAADVVCEREPFRAVGQCVTNLGWRQVYQDDDDDKKAEPPPMLPKMAKGDDVLAEAATVESKRTKPPPTWTDGTLVLGMAQIHKFITDPEQKRQLKESDGIGTEATRANIIKLLLRRDFVNRKGKVGLVSTPFGRSVIAMLPPSMTSATMTALWERKLSEVERGGLAAETFMREQADDITERVRQIVGSHVTVAGAPKPMAGHGDPCPVCGSPKVTRESKPDAEKSWRGLFCSVRSCSLDPEWDRSIGGGGNAKAALPKGAPSCPECKTGFLVRFDGVGKTTGKPYSKMSCTRWKEGCKYSHFLDDKPAPAKSAPAKGGKGSTSGGKKPARRRAA